MNYHVEPRHAWLVAQLLERAEKDFSAWPLSIGVAQAFLSVLGDIAAERLASGESFELPGIGVLSRKRTPVREGKSNGKFRVVKSHCVYSFQPAPNVRAKEKENIYV